MNIKEKIYTDFVGFKTTAELKTKFLHAQSLDKAKFTAILSALCDKIIASYEVKPHESELTTSQEVKPHNNGNIQEVKPHKSKKVKVIEKSMFEQDMAEQAEYESKHNINCLFEVEQ